MRLLFFDGSGSLADRHLVCAGVSIDEQAVLPLSGAVDELMNKPQWPFAGDELHTGPLMRGRGRNRSIPVPIRMQLFEAVLELLLASAEAGRISLHAVVHDNAQSTSSEDEAEIYRLLIDDWLRVARLAEITQRCLAIGDSSRLDRQIQQAMRLSDFGEPPPLGRSNLLAPPLFVDSRDSRLVQLADFVAYWTYRAFERGDDEVFLQLLPAFGDGRLRHETTRQNCECPACR